MATFLLALLLIPTSGSLASPDSLFASGNAAYTQGDYRAAHQAYLTLEREGFASAALYTNLGNTFYRLDSLARALQYYARGLELAPADARLAHNMRMVRNRLSLTGAEPPPPYWEASWRWMHRHVSPLHLFLAGLTCFLLAITLGARRIWTGKPSPWLRRGLFVVTPIALTLLALSFALSAGAGVVHRAVVLQDAGPMPDIPRADQASVRRGQVVRVLQHRQGRTEVLAADGRRGWIEDERLGEI